MAARSSYILNQLLVPWLARRIIASFSRFVDPVTDAKEKELKLSGLTGHVLDLFLLLTNSPDPTTGYASS